MATSSVGDFWRRRKIVIILGLILLCGFAAFLHMRGRGGSQKKVAPAQNGLVKNSMKNSMKNPTGRGHGRGLGKGKVNPAHLIRHLPPILAQQRIKERRKNNQAKARKMEVEVDDNYDVKGDVERDGDRKNGGEWEHYPGRDGDVVGEAPRGDEVDGGVAYLKPGQESESPLGQEGGKALSNQEWPEHLKNLPDQPGNLPEHLPESPKNLPDQPDQPRNLPKQLFKQDWILPEEPATPHRYQPLDVPEQNIPGNQPMLPGDQPGNQPVQPGNQPVQPGNQPVQPGNQPVLPGNQPVQDGVQYGNQPRIQPGNQPGIQPGNPLVQPGVQPDNSKGPVPLVPGMVSGHARQPADIYVHSSMPLGRPLVSTKTQRQEAVVQAFKHAWKAYKQYAWGQDEVNPISHSFSSNYFGMGMTLVDSLDTIWLMGLEEEFKEARDWVEQSLNFEHNSKTVSLFETNIRVLGGLLSAYHLSEDVMFLDKAVALGTRLLPAFQTPSGVPSNTVSISQGSHRSRSISTAEAGTLQLEFRDLSRATGNPSYQEKCDRTLDKMLSQAHGIVLQSLNCNSGHYSGSVYSAGAGTDSYYEYLIKQWIQSGKTENKFREAYETSVHDVLRYLIGYSQPSHMAYLGKRFGLGINQPPSPVMDHLSCFYPGMLALGVMYQVLPETMAMAANLTHTCYHMYESASPTGIAPEIFQFNLNPQMSSDTVRSSDTQNLQRPETVESLFLMYRLTKDQRYQDWGWKIFQAFEKYTKIEGGGYGCLKSVLTPGKLRDRTESFFLTETLKYLYLLFGDDDSVLSLQEWVFNTEAHPLPIWKMSAQ